MLFPPRWRQFFDEHVPSRVKARYLPSRRKTGRAEIFSDKDLFFFGPSIRDLSDTLGEGRTTGRLSYFEQARYRSAYLLYWLPLQAAKFAFLMDLHRERFSKAAHPATLRVLDLGSGPGTASIGVLLHALESPNPPKAIEFTWVDRNRKIMEDGIDLLESWNSPGLPKTTVRLISCDVAQFRPEGEWDLVLAGHVMNESRSFQEKLTTVRAKAGSLGMLMVEPATRTASQELIRLRETLKAEGEIVGPCLHSGACPLAAGRDWCHTSVPLEIPGKVFAACSKKLGSVREWIKFSYLWMGGPTGPALTKTAPSVRRVLTEPLDTRPVSEILVCEPGKTRRVRTRRNMAPYRGGLLTLP